MNPATQLFIEKLQEIASRGLDHNEAATEVGSSRAYLVSFASRHGIKFASKNAAAPPKTLRVPSERNQRMALLYRQGLTLEEIGTEYGITRERVRQILWADHGLRGGDGGATVGATLARAARLNIIDARCQHKYGCSRAQYREIKRAGATYAFSRLKQNASRDGFTVELTLWQWWSLWQESGHWNDRGRGHGYWLFRPRPDAPLSVDNYCIAPGHEAMSMMRQIDPSRFPSRGLSVIGGAQ